MQGDLVISFRAKLAGARRTLVAHIAAPGLHPPVQRDIVADQLAGALPSLCCFARAQQSLPTCLVSELYRKLHASARCQQLQSTIPSCPFSFGVHNAAQPLAQLSVQYMRLHTM